MPLLIFPPRFVVCCFLISHQRNKIVASKYNCEKRLDRGSTFSASAWSRFAEQKGFTPTQHCVYMQRTNMDGFIVFKPTTETKLGLTFRPKFTAIPPVALLSDHFSVSFGCTTPTPPHPPPPLSRLPRHVRPWT